MNMVHVSIFLCVSSSISFFNVLYFSENRSLISLVRFIPRYFIFLAAISNEIFSLISVSEFHCWYTEMSLISGY